MTLKRVAVIGAGPTGIAAIKSLKEEDMEPVCLERTGFMGGLWRYHDDDIEGLASVMKTTVINSSKEISAISDFPPGDDVPNYMHHKQVYKMLMDYSKTFGLEEHVLFYKEVIEIDMADDYDETGRLVVVVRDTNTQEVTSDTYDGVIVCIGHHVYPNIPSFPGMEKFKGKIVHTHSVKKVSGFEEQVVVVVGAGNSGMDAAVEISAVAKQVYLCCRRGVWVIPRLGPGGMPVDMAFTSRFQYALFTVVPYPLSCWYIERFLNSRFDHEKYNLKPKHRVLSQHPTISDTLPVKLLCGTVVTKKAIREFVENGVIFENENVVTECDSVVLATGYNIKFPFLNERLTTTKDNKVHLYKYIFPPHLKHPTLSFAGLIQAVGGGFPVFEAQSRLVSQVLRGKVKLPPKHEMEAEISKKRAENAKRYVDSQRHTIQADYIPYLDDINSLFGAKPNLWKVFFTDPVLFWTLFFGPTLPYQYRLQGPHAWPGARKAILEWNKRVIKPLKNDYNSSPFQLKTIIVFCFVLLLAVLLIIIVCTNLPITELSIREKILRKLL